MLKSFQALPYLTVLSERQTILLRSKEDDSFFGLQMSTYQIRADLNGSAHLSAAEKDLLGTILTDSKRTARVA